MSTLTKTTKGTIPTTYKELVKLHMLRPVHDSVDFENAMAMIRRLAGRKLNQDQEDYLEALSTLVEAYESELLANRVKPPQGHRLLEYLCEQNGIGGAQLGRILNLSRAQGANLLKGDRRLTMNHAVTLAKHFKIDGGLFLEN